jgi:hypothetical protein
MRLLRRVLVVVGAGALACVLLPISSAQAASTGGGGGGGGAPAAFFVVGDQSAKAAVAVAPLQPSLSSVTRARPSLSPRVRLSSSGARSGPRTTA